MLFIILFQYLHLFNWNLFNWIIWNLSFIGKFLVNMACWSIRGRGGRRRGWEELITRASRALFRLSMIWNRVLLSISLNHRRCFSFTNWVIIIQNYKHLVSLSQALTRDWKKKNGLYNHFWKEYKIVCSQRVVYDRHFKQDVLEFFF